MPSFDIVSSFDMQEVDNAVNMVVRDIANRYDFRGSKTNLTLDKGEKKITIEADNTMQLAAVVDMLKSRAISRKISLKVFNFHEEESAAGTSIRQKVSLKEGIDKDYLYNLIWKRDKSIYINKLDTHLTNLKKKLNQELNLKINFQSLNKKLRLLID